MPVISATRRFISGLSRTVLEQRAKDHAERVETLDSKVKALTDAQKAGQVGTATTIIGSS